MTGTTTNRKRKAKTALAGSKVVERKLMEVIFRDDIHRKRHGSTGVSNVDIEGYISDVFHRYLVHTDLIISDKKPPAKVTSSLRQVSLAGGDKHQVRLSAIHKTRDRYANCLLSFANISDAGYFTPGILAGIEVKQVTDPPASITNIIKPVYWRDYGIITVRLCWFTDKREQYLIDSGQS